jgi:transposase
VQVVLALATASNGLPIGYQLFRGNTAEVSTLLSCIDNWRKILPIGEIKIVADRAMMSEKNLQALEELNIGYVVAAKLKKLPKNIREQILNQPKDKNGLILDTTIGKRRLLVTFCRDRQAKDIKDRQRILSKINQKIGKGKNAKKLVSNSGYQKYLSCEGEANLFVDEDKVAQDGAWDGIHGMITNCNETCAEELLSEYRRLWVIEESFRIQKHNLSLRPIYHFKKERIEAHILICYIAFALIRHLEFRVGLQKETMSIEQIRTALWQVQSSYLRNTETNKKYRLPSAISFTAKKLYQVMGIKRFQTVQEM